MAECYGTTVEEVERVTTTNAELIFNLRPSLEPNT